MAQTTILYDQYFFERLGPVLKERRQKLGYTQKHVAEALEVSPRYVGYLEQGKSTAVALVTVFQLLETLGFEYNFRGGQVQSTLLTLLPSEESEALAETYAKASCINTPLETIPVATVGPYMSLAPVEELTACLPVEAERKSTPQQSPGLLNDFSMWFKKRFS